jgi:hypothetical protein
MQLSNNVFVVETQNTNAIVQLSGWRDQTYGASSIYQAKYDHLDHARWGAADNMPNAMRRLIEKNNQVRPELVTLRDMIYGSGGCWKQIDSEGKIKPFYDPKLAKWEKETKLARYEIAAINQLIDNANIFSRIEWDVVKGYPKLSISDSFHTRIQRPKDISKGITHYQVNPYFGEMQHFDTKETATIPAFSSEELDTDLVQILHSKEDIPGNPFYAFPTWWGSADWIELANMIPMFHKSGIKNGYNIKYLIKMPQDYFSGDGGQELTDKEVQDNWNKLEGKLKSMLSGEDKVNKSMLIKYMRGVDGKMMDNIDVIPLKNEMSDNAYSTILEMANLSIANSIGLLPTIAGVNPGKGNDSGSQIRVMADFQQAFRTVIPRTLITEAVNECVWKMGYENVFRWFDGITLTTLDANKEGKEDTSNIAHKNAA